MPAESVSGVMTAAAASGRVVSIGRKMPAGVVPSEASVRALVQNDKFERCAAGDVGPAVIGCTVGPGEFVKEMNRH